MGLFDTRRTTIIVLLANGFMEITCVNPWMPPLLRKWVYRRTVDYNAVAF